MAAMALQRFRFRGKTAAESALYLPIVIPEIVMGIGILTLFGVLFRWLNDTLGLAGDSKLAMGIGTVIISHITFSVPFVTLVVRARLVGFDTSLEEAAMDLGANEITTFWRITLPLILPGVLSGGLLAFTLSLDDFVITFFTTGPGASTLPIYVYGLLRRITTPELNALSTIWILLVLVALLLTQRLEKNNLTLTNGEV
jgi:spermidine/putrescine transport system permease protein